MDRIGLDRIRLDWIGWIRLNDGRAWMLRKLRMAGMARMDEVAVLFVLFVMSLFYGWCFWGAATYVAPVVRKEWNDAVTMSVLSSDAPIHQILSKIETWSRWFKKL